MIRLFKDIICLIFDTVKIKSIQSIIAISFTFITMTAMLFVGAVLYQKFSETAERNASISMQQIIEQVNFNLDRYLESMIEISNYINFKTYMSEYIPDSELNELLHVLIKTREDIVSLAIFSDRGELITGVPDFTLKKGAKVTQQNWFRMAIEKPNKLFFSSPHVQNLFKGQHKWVVSLSRNITFYRMDIGTRGVLLVDMNFRAIDDLCKRVSLGTKGYIYITDAYGNIVYHPQQQLIYMGLKDESTDRIFERTDGSYIESYNGEKRLITIKTVNRTGWKIIGISYLDEIVTTKREVNSFIGWIIIFGIIFVISVSIFISARISQPIKRLERSMKMVEKGHFDINMIDVRGDNEVEQLSKTFNIMVARIRELMSQILVEQEAKRKSELDALQAQINPHFLYNTLDSIVWMAENGKNQGVITMVTALARLFRISISKGRNIISVYEELEHVRNYLIIQKIRYKNKFRFEIKAQQETLQCKTLKLILQPLVENSIYHGIEYMVEEGMISISTAIIDGRLLLQVSDNGLGMSPEVLENILANDPKRELGSGVGVKNVHERIQLYFGKEYGLEIESKLEEGTNVKIWLPVVKDMG